MDLPEILRNAGRRLPRTKHQRPQVYAWKGKGKNAAKFWKVEYRVYDEDGAKPRHRAATWPAKDHTKTEAQKLADALIARETAARQRIDGTITVSAFWERVWWPTLKRQGTKNTQNSYSSSWGKHVSPGLGKLRLCDVQKADIDRILGCIADAGRSESTANTAYVLMNGILEEAHEEGYIERNPCRRVKVPACKPSKETQPITHEQAAALIAGTKGRTRLVWWIILATGARIGEVLALTRDDLLRDELRIDEGCTQGRAHQTKSKKIRFAPLPPRLHSELLAWLKTHDNVLIFPSLVGKILQRYSHSVIKMMKEGREATGVKTLTFRAGRTTFATLYQGDLKDLQATLGHASLDMTLGPYRKSIHKRALTAATEMEDRLLGAPEIIQ